METHAICVSCHTRIAANWAFCAYCGADNREPGHHPAVPPHVHYYATQSYCTVCGLRGEIAAVPDPDAIPKQGYTFTTSIIGWPLGTVSGIIFLGLLYFRLTSDPRPASTHQVPLSLDLISGPGWLFGVALFTAICFLTKSRLSLNTETRRIHSVKGVWPLFVRRDWSFSDAQAVVITSHYAGRGSYYYRTELVLEGPNCPLEHIHLMDTGFFPTAADHAQVLAGVLQVPYQDASMHDYGILRWF